MTDQRTNVELAPANQVDHRGVVASARPGPVRVARRNAGLVRPNDGDLAAQEDVETERDGGAGIRPGGSCPGDDDPAAGAGRLQELGAHVDPGGRWDLDVGPRPCPAAATAAP